MGFRRRGKQILLLVLGLTIAHFGVTLFIQADLGADPFNVLIQGIYRSVFQAAGIPWSHGATHMLVCFLIIIVLLFVDKTYIKIGTLICMFLGGPIIDMFTVILGDYINNSLSLAVRIPVLVAGCVILAMGMTIVIKSEAGTGPDVYKRQSLYGAERGINTFHVITERG